MKIHNKLEQGSDEWKELRGGRFGGTDAHLFLVKGKNKDEIGTGLQTAIYEKCGEKIEGIELDTYQSKAMQDGNIYEPEARKEYGINEFCTVQEVGYISMGDYFGVSPDGLVQDDGGIEIKCLAIKAYLRWLDFTHNTKDLDTVIKAIPKKYFAQIQWLMFLTGRKFIDYIVYRRNYKLIKTTVPRCEKTIMIFEEKAKVIKKEMDRVLNLVEK